MTDTTQDGGAERAPMLHGRDDLCRLWYNGEQMNPAPVASATGALTLRDAADRLIAGKPVSVTLEPGDATRYTFTLTPLWTRDACPSCMGLPLAQVTAERWVILTYYAGGEVRSSGLVPLTGDVRMYWHRVADAVDDNDWTVEMVCWWLDLLVRRTWP